MFSRHAEGLEGGTELADHGLLDGVVATGRGGVQSLLGQQSRAGESDGVETKRIRRQMHGRASFALLRHRILLA
ncbi:hypothetical protein Psi02_54610 [Planotetraspora silvatica]|uniref:Uncharacterized protein n=1 Tax=Planotetraspora silvatica TaxID=234614 RepID=A0A8J3UPU8_9ACTN|nr:hypothetical protein [Planotetraspora silvatica]GII49037.1 hypothetical protein Psi02_54610 [Planotetraspora silvatica]